MQRGSQGEARLARTAIVGFACNQGFVFSLFYLGSNQGVSVGSAVFERAELFGTLLFMVGAFTLLRTMPPHVRRALQARPLLWCYAALLVVGSFLPFALEGARAGALPLTLECILLGAPSGLMLAAWGRALGCFAIERSVPEVFIGSALGAAVCFVCACVPESAARLALNLLPLGSAAALRLLLADAAADSRGRDGKAGLRTAEDASGEAFPPPGSASTGAQVDSGLAGHTTRAASAGVEGESAAQLTLKIIAGTAVFGLATGFMETYGSDPGMETTPTFPVTLFLFVLFCLAALQLLGGGGEPPRNTAGKASKLALWTGEKRTGTPADDQGPLDDAYRLAVLLMMAGFLFVPVLGDFGVPGEAIVLAGYLGLSAVLVSLFLVMGRISGCDAALSFAQGFGALFAGEMAGIALGNALEAGGGSAETPYIVVACAGLAALFAYLFLFTDRDFRALSVAVRETDRFEEACALLAREAGLSRREAEILPLALKGRTGERIAAEFFISKSTVDTHLRRIYQKCGVHSRQELIDLGEQTERRLVARP